MIAKAMDTIEIRTMALETFLPLISFFNKRFEMKYSTDTMNKFWILNYTKQLGLKSNWILLLFVSMFSLSCTAQQAVVEQKRVPEEKSVIRPAADLGTMYLPLLKEKKVAVVGNQTSIVTSGNGETTHLVDFLLTKEINITKVFSPEHGFRGLADAGAKVNSSIDEKTKLPIVSLYGENKKPKKEQLKGVDIILFDLQDVGVRFYTYISTLTYVMEAAAEEGIPVVVLDRPNPNIRFTDGPILKKGFESFVGMHPVPVLYGMTIGEYGTMVNGEGWLKDGVKCDLTVIKIQGYGRNKSYTLPVAPSPNLQTPNSIDKYASLCLFEGTTVSIGRGTDSPFEIYGSPEFKTSKFSFKPVSKPGATKPLQMDKLCYGTDLRKEASLFRGFNLDYLFDAKAQLGADLKWITSVRFFNLLAGSDELYTQLKEGKTKEEIYASWKSDLEAFKVMRHTYLLY